MLTTIVSFWLIAAAQTPVEKSASLELFFRERACSAKEQVKASSRLEAIRKSDQSERAKGAPSSERDAARRAEVLQIFGTGCFRSADDFANAAVVLQHGRMADHFFMAYYFASRAVELGHRKAASLVPLAIDRYFMNRGFKQLFATQYVKPFFWGKPEIGDDWCVWPVEDTFDHELRTRYGGKTKAENRKKLKELNGRSVADANMECDLDLASPSRGLFPGVW